MSITLLTTALVPVFWQSTQALALSTRIKNTMVASNLAVEGVEIARSVRDANWLASAPPGTWFGLDDCLAPTRCEADFREPGLQPLAGDARPLLVDDAGLYQYDDGKESMFTRVITVTGTGDERVVTSRVAWRERGQDREVVLEYHLFDWLR